MSSTTQMHYHVLCVASLALLRLPTGVHGAAGGAFDNFSAATAAAAFIGAKNLTFIGCAGFTDASRANLACAGLVGHHRAECYPSPVFDNGTSVDICRCIGYAGLTPPVNCVDATCVWGADACSVRQWQNSFAIVLHVFSLLLTIYVFGFALYVIVVGRKNLKMNAMSVTLVSITLASMFHLVWRVCVTLMSAILLSTVPSTDVQKPVALPGFFMFSIVGVLAFPLQWLDVAKKTARIKATRGHSNKVPHIAVAVTAFVVAAAVIFFAITGQTFLISGTFKNYYPAHDITTPRTSCRCGIIRPSSHSTCAPPVIIHSSWRWMLVHNHHRLRGWLLQTHWSSRVAQQNGSQARPSHSQHCNLHDIIRSIIAGM